MRGEDGSYDAALGILVSAFNMVLGIYPQRGLVAARASCAILCTVIIMLAVADGLANAP